MLSTIDLWWGRRGGRSCAWFHVAWLLPVTPADVLYLLRWTMSAVETYFCAINVKGRGWIPRPEALELAQKCHEMTEPWQCSAMHVDVYAWQGRVQCPVRLGSVEAVEAFQAKAKASQPARDWVPLTQILKTA